MKNKVKPTKIVAMKDITLQNVHFNHIIMRTGDEFIIAEIMSSNVEADAVHKYAKLVDAYLKKELPRIKFLVTVRHEDSTIYDNWSWNINWGIFYS